MNFLLWISILVAIAIVPATLVGCASVTAAEAEATYLGQQLRCVDQHETRAAIDACRKDVRTAWGITETSRDAGGDQ